MGTIKPEEEPKQGPTGIELEAIKQAEPFIQLDELEQAEQADELGQEHEPEPADRKELEGALEQALQVVFDMIATRRGAHWGLKPGEAKLASGPLAEVLEAMGMGMDTPEARLAAVAGMILVPRVAVDIAQGRGNRAHKVEPEPEE